MSSTEKNNFSVSDLPKDYNFNGLDLVKFLCAYMICAMHINPIVSNTTLSFNIVFFLQQWLCRIAVPFYFTTSGFLLFRKIDLQSPDSSTIKRYCFRILRLLGMWYFLLFTAGNYQLWYMGALVLAVTILTVMLKANMKLYHIIATAILLYTIGLLGDSYYAYLEPLKKYLLPKIIIVIYDNTFGTVRNGVFFGFIFVLMGALFAHKKIIMNNAIAILGFIISMTLMFAEVYLLKNYSSPISYNMLIFLLPATFFLFYLSSHLKLKNSIIFVKLRIIGMLIFYLHMFVKHFVELGISILKRHNIDFSTIKFFFVVIITTLLAIAIEELAQKKNFRWLKYLYS